MKGHGVLTKSIPPLFVTICLLVEGCTWSPYIGTSPRTIVCFMNSVQATWHLHIKLFEYTPLVRYVGHYLHVIYEKKYNSSRKSCKKKRNTYSINGVFLYNYILSHNTFQPIRLHIGLLNGIPVNTACWYQ